MIYHIVVNYVQLILIVDGVKLALNVSQEIITKQHAQLAVQMDGYLIVKVVLKVFQDNLQTSIQKQKN